MEIVENSAEDAWIRVLRFVLENGNDFVDRDGRVCREVLNISLTVKSTESVTKPIEIVNSFKKWVYPPLEELEALTLSKKDIPGYYYTYGARAFNFNNSINQVDNYIIPLLKKDSSSRRASIVFYNPEKDSSLFRRDIPSLIMINFNIRGNKLHLFAVVRSNDLFFGWPANIYQLSVLQGYVAKALGIEKGGITTNSISAHIFEEQIEHILRII